ncbi:MAG TPA: ABC transporter permease, partial [Mycobacterium sp.]|nr:ABC transporter permease [Mycobacterium sp.]
MTAVESPPRIQLQSVRTHPTNIAQQSWIMVKRNMIHTKRMPEMLSDVTVQPIMFVLLFAFVFGASIATGGGASYREFLLPGIQAQTIVFTAFVVASGITADVEKGIIDRFRSLPISRSSVLIGRSVASLLHSSIGVVVMAVTGLAIGWRIRGSVAEAALAFALILVFGFAMIWFGILIGSVMRSVEAVNGVMFTVLFPITFLANSVGVWAVKPRSSNAAGCSQLLPTAPIPMNQNHLPGIGHPQRMTPAGAALAGFDQARERASHLLTVSHHISSNREGELRESRMSFAIGRLTWASCDILCACPRGARRR